MALHVIKKINTRLRFFYRKNRFLPQPLRRLLCNGIIQPHFAYVCSAWYPYLNKSLKKKLETQQNKCIRFCLNLNNRDHIGLTEFEKINWLPINDHFEQCISSTTFKFFNNRSSAYMNDVFKPAGHSITNTRTSFLKLIQPLRNTNYGQKILFYLAPNIWNSLPVLLLLLLLLLFLLLSLLLLFALVIIIAFIIVVTANALIIEQAFFEIRIPIQ